MEEAWAGINLDARSIYERILLKGNYVILGFISKKHLHNFRCNLSNIKRNTEKANAKLNSQLGIHFDIGTENLSVSIEIIEENFEGLRAKIYLAPRVKPDATYMILEDAPMKDATNGTDKEEE